MFSSTYMEVLPLTILLFTSLRFTIAYYRIVRRISVKVTLKLLVHLIYCLRDILLKKKKEKKKSSPLSINSQTNRNFNSHCHS